MRSRSRSRQQAHRRTVRFDYIWLGLTLMSYSAVAVVAVVVTWFAWALLMSLAQYIQSVP